MKFQKIFAALAVSLLFAAGCSLTKSPFEIRDVTMSEVSEMMDAKDTFILMVERDNCPFCSAMHEYLEETKAEHNDTIVYKLDTTNFELYREAEGDMTLISKTEDGQSFLQKFPYFLYTPTLYFIEDGIPVQAGVGYDEFNNTVSLWDVNSTIDWSKASTMDVWTFIDQGQSAGQDEKQN